MVAGPEDAVAVEEEDIEAVEEGGDFGRFAGELGGRGHDAGGGEVAGEVRGGGERKSRDEAAEEAHRGVEVWLRAFGITRIALDSS